MNKSVSDCYQTKIQCQDGLQSAHSDDDDYAHWQYSLWSNQEAVQMSSVLTTLWQKESNEWEKRKTNYLMTMLLERMPSDISL